MSPVSRGRRGKKANNKTTVLRVVPSDIVAGPGACDCPACTEPDFDPQELVEDMAASAADLLDCEDPLEAQIVGAAFVALGAGAEGFDQALLDGFIPQFEAQGSTEAMAMLLAIGSVAPDLPGRAAWAAADRLVGAGVAPPGWAAELREPVTVGDCRRVADPEGLASMLICSVTRAGRGWVVAILVDHEDCDAAGDILLLDAAAPADAWDMIQAHGRDSGVDITMELRDPADFRWEVERALDARAVHDDGLSDDASDDAPPYPVLATLVRAWLTALPKSGRPGPPHGGDDSRLAPLRLLEQFAGAAASFGKPGLLGGRASRAALPAQRKMPARRKKSAGPAPVYQIKMGLRGAKPPIWRRLEVPADVSLAELHTIIQIAFDWDDSHLHVFETAYGDFGVADAELGHRSDGSVTLEQVAPAVNSKLLYTYDFGDDWAHDILVEKVLLASAGVVYPRCTSGRRAAPPEDCGGVWGYAELLQSSTIPQTRSTRNGWSGWGSTIPPISIPPASTPTW